MSPASSGSLEVERYIGACLISSHGRTKNNSPAVVTTTTNGGAGKNCNNRDVYYPRDPFMHDVYSGGYVSYHRPRRCNSVDGWAGGMPLISFANHQRRNRRPDVGIVDATTARCSSPRVEDVSHSPLSRLAVHTQGLPLILSGRHGNHRRTKAARNGLPQGRGVVDSAKKIGECKDNHVNGVDTLSVASDESSGSNNSETSLPRIIKPRKRRKKDRKPHPGRNSQITSDLTSDTGSPVIKPYVPYCFDRIHPPRNNHVYVSDRYVVRNNSVVSDTSENDLSSETPQLHHRFEDVVGGVDDTDADDSGEPSSCQCRYCDPAGQIWDVDRHCYSPFLTTPPFQKQLSSDSSSSESSTLFTNKKQYLSDRISSALQSQCLISATTFSLDHDVHDNTVKICSNKDKEVFRPNRTQQCLEISTKIVTSPNGHRDLEIRLFSSSPIDDDRLTNDDNKTSKVSSRKTSDKCSSYNNNINNSNNKLCLESNESDHNLSPEE